MAKTTIFTKTVDFTPSSSGYYKAGEMRLIIEEDSITSSSRKIYWTLQARRTNDGYSTSYTDVSYYTVKIGSYSSGRKQFDFDMRSSSGHTLNTWYTQASGSFTATNASDGTYSASCSASIETDIIFGSASLSGTVTGSTSIKTYTITYNANGGSGAPSSQVKTHGTDLVLSSVKPTRTGYTFVRWVSTRSNGSTVNYQPGNTVTYEGNQTLVAQWKAHTYTITYNANGGSGAPSTQTKTHDTSLKLSATKPTRTGYTFVKWISTRSDGSTVNYQPGDTVTYEGNQTLAAQWSENYLTVNYYSNYATSFTGTNTPLNTVNGKNVLIYTVTYYYDNEYSSGLLNYNPSAGLGMTRTGHTNTNYWGTTTSGGRLVYVDTAFSTGQALAKALGKDISSSKASVNVYAQWKADTYTVTYDANGGTDAPAEQTKTYGITLTLSSDVPTKSGYTFLGWSTSSSSTSPTYYVGSSFATNANTTLYAVWEVAGEKTIVSLNKKIAKLTDGIRLNFNIKNSTNKHTIVWTSGSNSLTTHTDNSLSSGTFEYLLSEARFASWFDSNATEISVTVTVTTYNSAGVSLGSSSASFTLFITEELGKPSAPVATVTSKTSEGAIISLTKPTFKYNATFAEWIVTSNIGEVSVSGDVITMTMPNTINKTAVATIQVVDNRGFTSDPINIVWNTRKKGVCIHKDEIWSMSVPYVYVNGKWVKTISLSYSNAAWAGDNIFVQLEEPTLKTSEDEILYTSDGNKLMASIK